MNIEEKLAKSQDWNSIYFFREGIFAQVFGVSLYLAITQMNLAVKVCGYRYKKLNSELTLRAGLPTTVLESRYNKQLIMHEYGYELKGNWQVDLEGYQNWCDEQLTILLTHELTETKPIKTKKAEIDVASKVVTAELPKGTRRLLLSEQEYQFLKEWRQDKYPASIESGFIRGLNQKLISRA